MAYLSREGKQSVPRFAASAIAQGVPVRSSATTAEAVLPVATSGQRHLGFSQATAASPGDGLAVQTEGVAIGRACASLGPGVLVMVGSTNGRLAPLTAASGIEAYAVGESVSPAADGDYFSVLLKDGPGIDLTPVP